MQMAMRREPVPSECKAGATELKCLSEGTEPVYWQSWHVWYLGCVWLGNATAMDALVFFMPLLMRAILDNDPASPDGARARTRPSGV